MTGTIDLYWNNAKPCFDAVWSHDWQFVKGYGTLEEAFRRVKEESERKPNRLSYSLWYRGYPLAKDGDHYSQALEQLVWCLDEFFYEEPYELAGKPVLETDDGLEWDGEEYYDTDELVESAFGDEARGIIDLNIPYRMKGLKIDYELYADAMKEKD